MKISSVLKTSTLASLCILYALAVHSQQNKAAEEQPLKAIDTDGKAVIKNENAKVDDAEKPAEKKDEAAELEEKRIKYIKETISFGIQDERHDAIGKILLIKNEKGRNELNDILISLLKTEYSSDIKVKALSVLGELKLGRGTAEILSLLDDSSEDVRVAAVYALNSLSAVSSAETLDKTLRKLSIESDSSFHEALINALGDFKYKGAADFARDTISSVKAADTLREKLVLYLGKVEDTASKDFLLKLFKDQDEDITIRSYAVNSIGKIGAVDAAPDIKAALKEIDDYPLKKRQNYYSFSIYATAALVKLGDAEAAPRLMNSLKSNNAAVRIRAIELIRELKDKRTIDILKYKMKYDQNERVRKLAEETLKEMGVDPEGKADKPEDGSSGKDKTDGTGNEDTVNRK